MSRPDAVADALDTADKWIDVAVVLLVRALGAVDPSEKESLEPNPEYARDRIREAMDVILLAKDAVADAAIGCPREQQADAAGAA